MTLDRFDLAGIAVVLVAVIFLAFVWPLGIGILIGAAALTLGGMQAVDWWFDD